MFLMLWVGFVAVATGQAAEVYQLNLTDHVPDPTLQKPGVPVDIEVLEPDVYVWTLPDGITQTLTFDLSKLGVDLKDFDEFRFDMKPVDGPVLLHATTVGIAEKKAGHEKKTVMHEGESGGVSSWYSKFKQPIGQWTEGRFDLRIDDDGSFLTASESHREGLLTLELYSQTFGKQGEKKIRRVFIKNPRFVKRIINVDFDLTKVEQHIDSDRVTYTYPLELKNNTQQSQSITLDPDSQKTLHFFHVTNPGPDALSMVLEPHETRVVPIRVSMASNKAVALPALYSERFLPRVHLDQNPRQETGVYPLLGYRPNDMWAVVPMFTRISWTPKSMQAFLKPRTLGQPVIAKWMPWVIRSAEERLKYDWEIPQNIVPGHIANYRCLDCRQKLRQWPYKPLDIRNHYCAVCDKTFSGVERMDQAAVQLNYFSMGKAVRTLGLAWLLSGNDAYAKKAMEILLVFADNYDRMPYKSARSTSASTRLGCNTLLSSYILPDLAEGYQFLSSYAGLSKASDQKVKQMLIAEAAEVARHCVLYSNMSSEAMRARGTVGIVTGYWPLVGKAIHGDFGHHELLDKGFSEEGIGHEAGAYHLAAFRAANEFAYFAYRNGVNLYTENLKRVFDGSVIAGGAYAATSYETAYSVYRDSLYLPLLTEERKKQAANSAEHLALTGILGIPEVSTENVASAIMKGTGYIYLRKGTPNDYREIKLNYIKYFDRTEKDRFSTFFYENQKRIDGGVNRMSYGDRNVHFMYATAAHNAIVINGQDQRETTGELLAFHPDVELPVAVIQTDPHVPLYEGVQQIRATALVEDFYIVFDKITSEKPVTIDRFQYGLKKATVQNTLMPVADDFPYVAQKEHDAITNITGAPSEKLVLIDFENGMKMKLVSDKSFDIYKGETYGGQWQGDMDVTFARMADSTQGAFLAAFSHGTDKPLPQLQIISNSPHEILLSIATREKTYRININLPEETVSVTHVGNERKIPNTETSEQAKD